MSLTRRRFLSVPALALLGAPGCPGGSQEIAAAPRAAGERPTPRPGPHRSGLPTPTGAIERMGWEAERAGVARWVGIYAQPAVSDGRAWVNYRGDEDFPAASVIKVPVMLAVYDAWATDKGRSRKPAQVSLLRRMIQASDNPATNALVDWLGQPTTDRWRDTPGLRRVNKVIKRLLASEAPITRMGSKLAPPNPGPAPTNRGCPWEIAQLFVGIAERADARDPAAQEMISIMRGTTPDHRTRIPEGVPGAHRGRVANKTGTLARVVNDAALVDVGQGTPYVLVILMDGVTSIPRAERVCRAISAACWRLATTRPRA